MNERKRMKFWYGQHETPSTANSIHAWVPLLVSLRGSVTGALGLQPFTHKAPTGSCEPLTIHVCLTWTKCKNNVLFTRNLHSLLCLTLHRAVIWTPHSTTTTSQSKDLTRAKPQAPWNTFHIEVEVITDSMVGLPISTVLACRTKGKSWIRREPTTCSGPSSAHPLCYTC